MAECRLFLADSRLLMTPAAYHREVEHGEDTARFHRVASRFVLIAPIPLAFALAGEFFVVARMVLGTDFLPAIGGGGRGALLPRSTER